MILGSHNSLTYLRPTNKWWNMFFRCQDKDLDEQFKSGVTMLDIKVRFDLHSNLCITNYKWESELQWEPKRFVQWLLTKIRKYQLEHDKPIYINLTLDTDDIYIGQELDFITLGNLFKEYIGKDINKIILTGGHRTCDNSKVIVTIPDMFIAYPTNKCSNNCRWYEKPFPKLFAKRNNERNMKLWENEDCVVAFDFV